MGFIFRSLLSPNFKVFILFCFFSFSHTIVPYHNVPQKEENTSVFFPLVILTFNWQELESYCFPMPCSRALNPVFIINIRYLLNKIYDVHFTPYRIRNILKVFIHINDVQIWT